MRMVKNATNNKFNNKPVKKRICAYCTSKTTPSYTDVVSLKRFTSGRGKIVPKQRSGACSKHQRGLTREIKRARFLALLPFTLRV